MKFLEVFDNNPIIKSNRKEYINTNAAHIRFCIAAAFLKSKKDFFVVLPNLYDAQKYYDAFSQLLGDENVLFFPADQVLTSILSLGSPEFKNERLFTLRALLNKEKKYVVVTTYQGILQYQLTPKDYERSQKVLQVGDEYDILSLAQTLLDNGYIRTFTVERPGEFSIRGNILDIYSHDNPNPYRLDFFGNELEIIKEFDVISQRSFQMIEKISIAPLNELFYTNKQKENAVEKIINYFGQRQLSEAESEKLANDLENINSKNKLNTLNQYIPFFNEKITTVLDFSSDYELFVIDKHKIQLNISSAMSDLKTYSLTMNGDVFTTLPYFINPDYLLERKYKSIASFDFNNSATNLEVKRINANDITPAKIVSFLDMYPQQKRIILYRDEKNLNRLKDIFNAHKVKYVVDEVSKDKICFIKGASEENFIDHLDNVLVISDAHILGQKSATAIRYRSVINQATKIRESSELNNGDYVVHYDFGIGKYIGLKTMTLGGKIRDYLHIVYANNEYLYVPVDQIELVMKYSSADDPAPTLTNISSNSWSKTKTKVKMKIKAMADQLISLYAQRHAQKGHIFNPFIEQMVEIVDDFSFSETPDQDKAIKSTLDDMQKDRPMDRLIAGDVGFGKTEVAIRAAYNCVLNGKQVAYLCPTTVLARQHYLTFKDRLEKYGVSVSLLSRFVSPAEIKETIKRIEKGLVDIVIGTHRLLSDDIKFHDLGLFVVDEEQRFGVMHKEKIRQMKVNVDALTLTATPIPRTLQMAIYGIKDLSTIDTPPLNRYPIQTYVIERQDALIKEAIEREIARGGQVFYLFNNVEGIEAIAHKIRQLVPESRVAIAHGQMSKDRLEKELSKFINHEFDVLVSTTIIETGVDIPNSNTLIIHDADRLGLAQLYQIRGRVGRSDKIAYAYLMYDGRKNINDEARKRLAVIEDFTALGSGYKIALRDLSIRGSGDILSTEQSGFIDAVGIDMYMQLLEETIHNKEPLKRKEDDIETNRHIPTKYINNDAVRIEIHKKIAKIHTFDELKELEIELIDRFGQFDENISTYMHEKLLNKLMYLVGVKKIRNTKGKVEITFNENKTNTLNSYEFMAFNEKYNGKTTLSFDEGCVCAIIYVDSKAINKLNVAISYLEYIKTFILQEGQNAIKQG